ncbi:hypothetical protein K438DRAFT_1835492 [Mycena galopus ATCC 62051]|nr:hypothetical protein K438DRAFT_1835492 [Mycena galopus ATCC 62051]
MSIANQVPAVELPAEVLAQIFTMCLKLTDLPYHLNCVCESTRTFRPSDAPLLVASVCQRWREVAISTHRLWPFSLGRRKNTNSDGVVASWVSRSRGTFAIKWFSLPQIMQEIICHCEQWREVGVIISNHNHHLFEDLRGRLPHLAKLCLHLGPNLPHIVESFADAPELKEVHLGAGGHTSVLLPWHQLTKLTCQGFTDIQCITILRQCQALVDCCFIGHAMIHDPQRSHGSITSLSPILYHCIVSFEVQGTSDFDTLRLLTLPSLRVLGLELTTRAYPDYDTDVEILISFLKRSACRLENISLCMCDAQTLLRCSPFLASLITLKIQTCEVFLTDDILRLFRDRAVFPNLRRCLASGNSPGVHLDAFRLVYTPHRDGDATGLVILASELQPLVAPSMAEFQVSPDSNEWL